MVETSDASHIVLVGQEKVKVFAPRDSRLEFGKNILGFGYTLRLREDVECFVEIFFSALAPIETEGPHFTYPTFYYIVSSYSNDTVASYGK